MVRPHEKVLSILLALVLALSALPAPALAEMAEEASMGVESMTPQSSAEDSKPEPADQQPAEPSHFKLTLPSSTYAGEEEGDALNNQALLEAYIGHQFGSALSSSEPLQTQSAYENLSEHDQQVFDALKPLVTKVANGERESTEFTFGVGAFCDKTKWTAADLGVSALIVGNSLTQEANDALVNAIAGDVHAVEVALLRDCPYEMYWHDLTGVKLGTEGLQLGLTQVNGETALTASGTFDLQYAVASEFRSLSDTPYAVNTSIGTSVQAAVTKAQGIASAHANKPAYERLKAYKEAICGEVDYNHEAVELNADEDPNNDVPYGNPWQLLWVFDNDQNTKVVCEGYSKAFKYLCDLSKKTDVECITASGTMATSDSSGGHMWDVVRMDDGKNYLVDVTNCDDGSVGAPDKLFMAYGPSGSYADGYVFTLDDVWATRVGYAYDGDTKQTFGEQALTISATPYTAPAPQNQVEVPAATEGLVYDGTEQVGVPTGTGYTMTGNAATDAGDYTATATLEEGFVWSDGTSDPKQFSWSIGRKQATVTADDKTKAMSEADPELTATVSGTLNGDQLAYSLSRAEGDEIGTYAITASGDATQGNYEVTYAPGTLTITRARAVTGTWGTCQWEINTDGVLTVHPGTGTGSEGVDSPWSGYASSVTSVVFAAEDGAKVVLPEYSVKLFRNLNQVTSMDLSGADASHAAYLYNMFEGCSSLTSLVLSGWNTSSATDMSSMFSGCTNLQSLDLSGCNISGSTNFMFYGCSKLASLNLAGCTVTQLRSAISMFEGCSSLESVDLAGWGISQVTSMRSMFEGCSKLSSVGDLSGWNTSNVTDMHYVFKGCSSLANLNLAGWDTSKVTSMTQMFYGCTSLETLDLSNWTLGGIVPSFAGCSKLATLSLSGWNTQNVTNMANMFDGCSNLATLDLSDWKTSNVINMSYMFKDCSSLASVGDLSDWDTSNVTNMSYMFKGCSSLTALDLSGWDASQVTGMTYIFYGCDNLASLDLSGWKLGSVSPSFEGCSKLATLNLSGCDTSNVTNMSFMFSGCSSLSTLDLSDWNTAKVTNMQSIFSRCSSLASLDLTGWDTSKVTVAVNMFNKCTNLASLKVGTGYTIGDDNMFPDPTAENGKWWSVKNQAWYAKGDITSSRSCVADTYTNHELTPIDNAIVVLEPGTLTYAGAPLTPIPTVTVGNKELVYDTDFTCSYENNVNAGTATVTITGKGVYDGSLTTTFQIAKAPLTVRARGGEVVYGSEPGDLVADYEGLVGTDTVESLAGSFVLSCARTQYSSVGGYPVTFSSKTLSSDNYDIGYVDGTITVVPRSVGLSWSNTSFTYDGESHCPTATATGTVNGDEVTVAVGGAQTNAGTYTAEATSVSNENYRLPEGKSVEFSINKAAIEPTVSIEGWTYGEQPSQPTVFGNTGGGEVTILYGAKDALVTDYVVDPPTNAGDYVVRAVVAETANYKAGVATAFFSVSKATPSLTLTPMAKAGLRYTGQPLALIGAGRADGGTLLYQVGGGQWMEQVPKETDAGTYMVGYKIKGDENHLDTDTLGTVVAKIDKAANTLLVPQSVTAVVTGSETDLSKLVEGGVGEVSYSISGEGLTGCSVTPSGTFTAGDVIGTCVVAVTAAGDKNHKPASADMEISVGGDVADATIALADGQGPFVYTDNAIEPEFVVKVGDVELVLNTDYTLGFSNNTNAGTATATIAGKGNYAGTKTVEFSIARKPVTVTAENKSKAYGEADPALTATVVGLVGEDTVAYTVSRTPGDTPGEYAITPTGDAEQGNYSVSYEPGKLIISKANVSAAEVASIEGQTFSGSELEPAVSVTLYGRELTAGTDYDVTYANNVNAGTAIATVTGKGNYAGTKAVEFSIARKPVNVPVAATGLVYDGTERTGVPAGEGYALTGDVSRTDAGTYAATATLDANHVWAGGSAEPVDVNWSIASKGVTVTADDKSKVYGADDPALTVTVEGLLGEDIVAYEVSRAEGDAPGEYAITPTGDAEQGNYAVTYVPGKLTITKADVSTAEVASIEGQTFSGSELEPAVSVTLYGRELTAGTDYDVTYADNVNAGSATATVTGKGNYAGTKVVEFSIARKPVTVTAENKSKVYGAVDPALTATVEGLLVEDTVAYEVSRAPGDDAGEYAITPAGEAEQGNYAVTYVAGKLTIAPADISAAEVDPVASQKYTGSAVTPKPVVRMGSATLEEGTDYDLSYASNVEPGTATVTVTGKGNYAGSTGATFTIAARDFPDVPEGAWYEGVVARAVWLGLLNGYANGSFGPDDKITRGQVAVVLWNMAKSPAADPVPADFPDVPSDQYYYRAVQWAFSKGVVNGYADGRFGPNDNVTREQLAVMLANYARNVGNRTVEGAAEDYGQMQDKDDVSPWAVTSVGWCFRSGILSGSGGNVFPQGNATRAEASKMVVFFHDMPAEPEHS